MLCPSQAFNSINKGRNTLYLFFLCPLEVCSIKDNQTSSQKYLGYFFWVGSAENFFDYSLLNNIS